MTKGLWAYAWQLKQISDRDSLTAVELEACLSTFMDSYYHKFSYLGKGYTMPSFTIT